MNSAESPPQRIEQTIGGAMIQERHQHFRDAFYCRAHLFCAGGFEVHERYQRQRWSVRACGTAPVSSRGGTLLGGTSLDGARHGGTRLGTHSWGRRFKTDQFCRLLRESTSSCVLVYRIRASWHKFWRCRVTYQDGRGHLIGHTKVDHSSSIAL